MDTKDISDEEVLLAYEQARNSGYARFADQVLRDMTKQPKKVCYAACERAAHRGLVNYGTSLCSGWVTERGWHFFRRLSLSDWQREPHGGGPATQPLQDDTITEDW